MKSRSTYALPFSSLKNGIHEFNYLVEHPFFANYEYSPVTDGRVWVNVTLNRQEIMLVIDFVLNGTVNVACSICNDFFDLEIEDERRLIVKFGDSTHEESDEILVLSRGEHEFDIAQYIYEYILLNVPLKPEHPEDENGKRTCNPEVLSILDKVSHKGMPEGTNDPRWDTLKKIKTKKD